MISLLAKGLVFAGVLILIRALITVRRLIEKLPSGPVHNRWYAMTVLIILFVIGYLGYLATYWNNHSNLLDLLVPGVFFLGACFVWLTAILSLQTAMDFLRISRLERESFTDPLTGLFNGRYLDRRLKEEVGVANRYGLPLSIMMLDIDHFKQVNDQHGHQIGDQVLICVGEIAAKALRKADLLARYGGEEFLIIAPHTLLAPAADLAERLRKCVESHEFQLRSESGGMLQSRVTVSIGVAQLGENSDSVEKLAQFAGENLYRAKHAGRNRVVADATPD